MPYRGGGSGGGVTNGAGANVITKSDGVNLVASSLTDNATVVTGTEPFRLASGTAAVPSYSFTNETNTGLFRDSLIGGLGITIAGGEKFNFSSGANGQLIVDSASSINWSSSNVTQATDVGIKRLAAGVLGSSNGGVGSGWLQITPGRVRLSGNYTNATATFSNTALSVTLIGGRVYSFHLVLFISNSTAGEGCKIDFNGGSAGSTNFVAQAVLSSATGTTLAMANSATNALATVINATTLVATTQCSLIVDGTFEPSGNGTFIVRAAENSTATGTLTIARGSYLWVEDMP